MGDFQIKFVKNRDLIANGDSACIDIALPDPSLAPTLVDKPFPRRQINFLNVQASATGSTDMAFAADRGAVNFAGNADASHAVQIFPLPSDAAAAINLDPDFPFGLDLPADAPGAAATHYDVIRWTFDANASVSGKVALGVNGAVSVGATASAGAISAVVRRFVDGALAGRDELIQTAGNWMLPSHVKGASSLDPHTWVIAEVEGSLDLSLGAEYGLNYNWVRSAKLGALSGDIGLKLQAGISATLGVSVAGKYVVVVSRETDDPKIRVRIFKLARNGFSFALDAGLSANADTSALTPDSADDFIAAVLGVHGAQVIRDLKAIDSWSGSGQTLSGLLAQAGNDYVIKLVQDLTGIDVRLEAQRFAEAKEKVQNFLDRWTDLSSVNHNLSTLLLKFVEKRVDLGPVKIAAEILANGAAGQLTKFVGDKLTQPGFPQTPLARFLETTASRGVLALLQEGPVFNQAKDPAAAFLRVLDGGSVEDALLKLATRLETNFGLKDLIAAVKTGLSQADFDKLDKLLQVKLANLIDKDLDELGLGDLEKIANGIGQFLAKRQDIYSQAVKALNHVYKAEFTETYEQTSTRTALLDIEFDFAQDGGTMPALMSGAIDGKFFGTVAGRSFNLLTDTSAGVTVRQGAITHNLTRHKHQEVHLPMFMSVSSHLNTGDAKLAVNTDRNRVIVSAGKDVDSDSTEFQKNRSRCDSTLSVLAQFGADKAGRIDIHDLEALAFSYQLRRSTAKATQEILSRQLAPLVGAYFGPVFSGADGRLRFPDLLRAIDNAAGGRSNLLGQTLVSLDLAVPPKAGSAWFLPQLSPDDEDSRLAGMSRAIQTAMRRIVPYVHFQDVSQFDLSETCSAFLLYAATPPMARKDFRFFFPFFPVADLLTSLLGPLGKGQGAATEANLDAILSAIRGILANTPGADASGFGSTAAKRIIAHAQGSQFTQQVLTSLFGMEKSIIDSAVKARANVRGFQASFGTDPDAAIKSLADFSANLVQAFNDKVGSFATRTDKPAIRSLSSIVFLEASLALAGPGNVDMSMLPDMFAASSSSFAVATAGIEALLEVAVLKPGAAVPDEFFTGQDPDPATTMIATRIFNRLLAAAPAGASG
jgi:hypothetical protein